MKTAVGGLLILIAVVILSRNEMRRDKQAKTEQHEEDEKLESLSTNV